MFAPVRVVVVDDRPDHLFAIANALAVSGISCIWHLYDSSANRLVPPPPKDGYPGIRLLVSDLNIREVAEAGRDPKNLAGILLSDVLLPLLPRISCSYGLVLWSNIQVKAEEVASIIGERISHPRIPVEDRRSAPLSVGMMDKAKFVTNLPSAGTSLDVKSLMHEAMHGIKEVADQINQAISDAQLRLVCAWESRVAEAAASTINSVHAAAELQTVDGRVSKSHGLKEVLAKLAQEAVGKKDAKDNPSRALDDGLVDLLVDGLRSTDDADSYQKIVNESLKSILTGAPVDINAQARHQLNTDLQIESKISPGFKKIARGLILGASDDKLIAGCVGQQKPSAIIWAEFLMGVDQFRRAADQAAATGHRDAAYLKDLYERAECEKEAVEKMCRIRLLEIGADCDHAQRKPRTVRLLIALEIPEKFAHFLYKPGSMGDLKLDSLIKFGPWVLSGCEPTILVVSVSRFFVRQDWQLTEEFQPLYRLRKPLVDVVLHKYASYSARPGYVAITGDS